MFDILDFIDSKDIREFNKNTFFYPIEKAVLINYSLYTSAEKKLSAWKELLDTYTEEEFEQREIFDNHEYEKSQYPEKRWRSNKAILADAVNQYEYALNLRGKTPLNSFGLETIFINNLFFETKYYTENGYDHSKLFSTYQKAYEYLVNEISEYGDDMEFVHIEISAKIPDTPFDNEKVALYTFRVINNVLEMTNIEVNYSEKHDDWGLQSFFVNVPLPFKKGDIVKLIYPTDDCKYGVVEDEMDKFFDPERMSFRDANDMLLYPYVFTKSDKGYNVYDPDNVFLYYEICSKEELPRDLVILADFSDVCLGKKGFGQFLVEHNDDIWLY